MDTRTFCSDVSVAGWPAPSFVLFVSFANGEATLSHLRFEAAQARRVRPPIFGGDVSGPGLEKAFKILAASLSPATDSRVDPRFAAIEPPP